MGARHYCASFNSDKGDIGTEKIGRVGYLEWGIDTYGTGEPFRRPFGGGLHAGVGDGDFAIFVVGLPAAQRLRQHGGGIIGLVLADLGFDSG